MNRNLPCLTLEKRIWRHVQASAEHRNSFCTGKAEGTGLLGIPNLSPPKPTETDERGASPKVGCTARDKIPKGRTCWGLSDEERGTSLQLLCAGHSWGSQPSHHHMGPGSERDSCDKESDGNIMPKTTLHPNRGQIAMEPKIL